MHDLFFTTRRLTHYCRITEELEFPCDYKEVELCPEQWKKTQNRGRLPVMPKDLFKLLKKKILWLTSQVFVCACAWAGEINKTDYLGEPRYHNWFDISCCMGDIRL
jgi:hypothetical protein